MSANETASEVVIDSGPTIITVPGQDGHVEELDTEAAKPVAPVVAVKAEVTGLEENDQSGKKVKPGVQDRIDELTRSRREAEREAEYWKVRAQGAGAPAKAAETNQAPTRDKFQTDEAYVDALTDYKVDQKLAGKLAERDTQQEQAKANQTKADSWQSKLAAARVSIPDFDDTMNANKAPVAGHVAELIMENDHGAEIAHHFASHPEELAKINEMTPAKVAFAIGKLEAKFEAATQESASSSKPGAVISKAPPPAARTVGSGRSTTVALGDLPMEDYVAARKAQGAGWAR